MNEWIPIDEKNPKPGEYVLLSFSNCTLPLIGRYEEDEDGGGAYYEGDYGMSLSSQDLFVNAWMPLPKRYEED